MGFRLDDVKAAVKKRLLGQGIKFYRVAECTEAVCVSMEQRARVEQVVGQILAVIAKRDEDMDITGGERSTYDDTAASTATTRTYRR